MSNHDSLFSKFKEVDTIDPTATQDQAPIPEEISWEIGTIILDEYKVIKSLGKGGSGAVYLVERIADGDLFAVKKSRFSIQNDALKEKLFFRELRTWIDLPEHPHLTACYFFRSTPEGIIIFSEYVDGGSLSDWIHQGKLTDFKRVLDISIQFAWGLGAVHSCGMVHKDIKPGNVLMMQDGTVKVADFGLARVHELIHERPEPSSSRQSLSKSSISSGLMTPAFSSPEQSRYLPLDFRTDIWSYGVSILTLFTGPPKWMLGTFADKILENYTTPGKASPILPIPESVAKVLVRCLQQNPKDRWNSMDLIADEFVRIYETECNMPYPRKKPQIKLQAVNSKHPIERQTLGGGLWDDPMIWLNKALVEAGEALREDGTNSPEKYFSRKSQALADLEIYDEAARIFQRLIEVGRDDLRTDLSKLLLMKASVHKIADDSQGAIATYDRCISIRKEIVSHAPSHQHYTDLSVALNNKALTLINRHEYDLAMDVLNTARSFMEPVIQEDDDWKKLVNLSDIYEKIGMIHVNRHQFTEALDLFLQSLKLKQKIVEEKGQKDRIHDLLRLYLNTATVHWHLGQLKECLAIYKKAIPQLETMVFEENRSDLVGFLTTAMENSGTAYARLGQNNEAQMMFEKNIRLLEDYVNNHGRSEFIVRLACSYYNRSNSLISVGNNTDALDLVDKSIAIYEKLVKRQGQSELLQDLISAYRTKGNLYHESERYDEAMAIYNMALEMINAMKDQNRIERLRGYLQHQMAKTLLKIGRQDTARLNLLSALEALEPHDTEGESTYLHKIVGDCRALLKDDGKQPYPN